MPLHLRLLHLAALSRTESELLNQSFEIRTAIFISFTNSLSPGLDPTLWQGNELFDFGSSRFLESKGKGDTSYARNSSLQKQTLDTLKHLVIESAVDAFYGAFEAPCSFVMADIGCSSGPNALLLVEDIVEAISRRCSETSQPPPEFMVYLNDLLTNDFNTLFAGLPELSKRLLDNGMVFIAGVPGSFYGRLFPRNSLHFISSCYSLHWLSQVPSGLFDNDDKPINKGKMCISETSPPDVAIAYTKQFQQDFNIFLKSRSEELSCGGRMVFTMLGRKTKDHNDKRTNFLWELLSESFAILASQGAIEEEKIDSYNVPFFAPNIMEIENEVHKEGSFLVDHIQDYEININRSDAENGGRIMSQAIRAIQESMICHHFGRDIIDSLFQIYQVLLSEATMKDVAKGVHIVVILRKQN